MNFWQNRSLFLSLARSLPTKNTMYVGTTFDRESRDKLVASTVFYEPTCFQSFIRPFRVRSNLRLFPFPPPYASHEACLTVDECSCPYNLLIFVTSDPLGGTLFRYWSEVGGRSRGETERNLAFYHENAPSNLANDNTIYHLRLNYEKAFPCLTIFPPPLNIHRLHWIFPRPSRHHPSPIILDTNLFFPIHRFNIVHFVFARFYPVIRKMTNPRSHLPYDCVICFLSDTTRDNTIRVDELTVVDSITDLTERALVLGDSNIRARGSVKFEISRRLFHLDIYFFVLKFFFCIASRSCVTPSKPAITRVSYEFWRVTSGTNEDIRNNKAMKKQ